MPYLIGTDEAGYGPNLGPLVVAATVWHIGPNIEPTALAECLPPAMFASPEDADENAVVWADSKAIYRNGRGLNVLERGVLTALGLTGELPRCWSELWPSGKHFEDGNGHVLPWDDFTADLPLWGTALLPDAELTELTQCLRSAGVDLISLRRRAVFPAEFNALVSHYGNKAEALSNITLGLVREALAVIAARNSDETDNTVQVWCDKHGGRNRYAGLVQSHWPDAWVEVRRESADESLYRFAAEGQPIEIGFRVRGERFLPTAVASMTAKYLREAAMLPFNNFWCNLVPGLLPTAGYPVDAKRFKLAIAAEQQRLGIEDNVLWRCR